MKKYLVTRTIKLTHTVEANSKSEAISIATDLGEYTGDATVTETAKILHGNVPKNLPGRIASWKQRGQVG